MAAATALLPVLIPPNGWIGDPDDPNDGVVCGECAASDQITGLHCQITAPGNGVLASIGVVGDALGGQFEQPHAKPTTTSCSVARLLLLLVLADRGSLRGRPSQLGGPSG